MDRRERFVDESETLRLALAAAQSRLWTALPGVVSAFDAARMTVDVQPAHTGQVPNPDGTMRPLNMPLLSGVPVLWQGGGGITVTFPIAPGDECLVIFASRCIDYWWTYGMRSNGRAPPPRDIRMHNLSDGFALVGVRCLPRAFQVDTANACISTDDRTAFFKLNPASKSMNLTAPGGVVINGVNIDSSGNVTTSATITADTDMVGGGKSLKTHVHGGVQTGGGNTGAPV